MNHILLPHSGWSPTACSDICWSTVFRNTSGVLRYDLLLLSHIKKKNQDCIAMEKNDIIKICILIK